MSISSFSALERYVGLVVFSVSLPRMVCSVDFERFLLQIHVPYASILLDGWSYRENSSDTDGSSLRGV